MIVSLHPLSRSRRLLALGLLAWLMLVIGAVHLPPSHAMAMPGMAGVHAMRPVPASPDECATCCRHGASVLHGDCPAMSLPAVALPAAPVLRVGVTRMPVPAPRGAVAVPDRPGGPPPRPPQA